MFGQLRPQEPSPFLAEIPPKHARIEGGIVRPGVSGMTGLSERVASRDALASFFGDAEIAAEDVSQENAWEEPAWTAPANEEIPQAASSRPLKKGDKVRHSSFGVGQIMKMEATPGKTMLTVYFSSKGRTVKLVEEFAKLVRL